MAAPKITVRKYLGNDGASWAVFLNDYPAVCGLTRRELAYYKALVLKRWTEKQNEKD